MTNLTRDEMLANEYAERLKMLHYPQFIPYWPYEFLSEAYLEGCNNKATELQGTIEAQQAEIETLKNTLALSVINSHNLIDSTYDMMSNEIAKLRGLLLGWFELSPELDIQNGQNYDITLIQFEQLDKRTQEALGVK